jgi:hypothetical protein
MRAHRTVENAVMKVCGVEGRAVPVERDGPFFLSAHREPRVEKLEKSRCLCYSQALF